MRTETSLKQHRLIWAVLLCGSLLACGSEPPGSAQREIPPLKVETPAVVPAPAQTPVSQETRAAYQWYCTQCHGAEGKGDGPNAVHLAVPPRNHTKADYLETRTDRQLFEAIKLGGLAVGRAPCMPAWGHTLDDGTIRSLVRYIRELCQCEGL